MPPGDPSIHWPSWAELANVLALGDYNTRVVVLGVTLLGAAAGLIGSFLLLRKRALLGDALSHATLPGIGIAFLAGVALGESGKSLPLLLAGASVSGALGIAVILLIVHFTRIKEDAALAIVLSVFFGLGVCVLGVVQSTSGGDAAGLKSFIYGKTASMLMSDAVMIAVAAGLVTLACLAFYKEFALICFDPGYGRAQGWPVGRIDVLMMTVVTAVTVIGLQAVGLVLMVALLVIPAAAARFWTHHLPTHLAVAAGIGAASGYLGASLSALLPRLPAGAVIVLVAGVLFGVSMLIGPARGIAARQVEQARLRARVGRQHLLRALYELTEPAHGAADGGAMGDAAVRPPAAFDALLRARSWSAGRLRRRLSRAAREGLVEISADGRQVSLTPAGLRAAQRTARNHRLWELYLIAHADIAPSHVDRDADEVEHVLDPEMIRELEALMSAGDAALGIPPSPHRLGA